MGTKLPWPEILVTTLVVAAGAGVYLYAHRDESALEASKQRGARIVEGLAAYERETGTYPTRLEDLVPEYLPAVEPPLWGLQRWRYRTYMPEAPVQPQDSSALYFQLSVAADPSGYPVLYYDFATGRWVLNN